MCVTAHRKSSVMLLWACARRAPPRFREWEARPGLQGDLPTSRPQTSGPHLEARHGGAVEGVGDEGLVADLCGCLNKGQHSCCGKSLDVL